MAQLLDLDWVDFDLSDVHPIPHMREPSPLPANAHTAPTVPCGRGGSDRGSEPTMRLEQGVLDRYLEQTSGIRTFPRDPKPLQLVEELEILEVLEDHRTFSEIVEDVLRERDI